MPNIESMCQVNGVSSGGKVSPHVVFFCNGAYSVADDPLTVAPTALAFDAGATAPAVGSYPLIWPYKPKSSGSGAYAVAAAGGSGIHLIITNSTVLQIDDTEIPLGIPAAAGTPPSTARTCCIWQGRLVVSDGRNWYMSRVETFNDWDYAATDDAGAVAGNNFTGGVLGDSIVALVPSGDDTLYVFCSSSIYRIVGNPKAGGRIDTVSRNVGILDKKAWDYDPTGAIWFADKSGLWVLFADGNLKPISRDKIASAFANITTADYVVTVVWHEPWRSAFVFLTPTATAAALHLHYYLPTDSLWLHVPASNNIGPMSAISYKSDDPDVSNVLCGGRDSKVRYWDLSAVQDDGTDYISVAFIGPIEITAPGREAKIISLDVTLGETMSSLPAGSDWQFRAVLQTAADAYSASVQALATQQKIFDLYTGYGKQDRQACRIAGQTAMLRVDNLNANGSLPVKKFWSVDRMYFIVSDNANAGREDGLT